MEQHIAALTRTQRDLGLEVISVFNSGDAVPPSIKVPMSRDISTVRYQTLRDLWFYLSASANLGGYRDQKINVVHVHGDFSAFYMAAALLSRRLDAKLMVASVHGELSRPPSFYRKSLSSYGLIAATGAVEVQRLKAWTKCDIMHFPSGIAEDFFQSSPNGEASDVIAVGSLVPVKRTETLVFCAKQRPELKFSVFGEGPERERLEELKANLGCPNIRFFGKANRPTVAAALRASRVFVNMSRSEGTPTAMLEAMAAGLPVVMTPSNDYRWILRHRQNGFLTDGWGGGEITSAIDWCLADEQRRLRIGRDNIVLAQNHRWTRKAQDMTEAMISALVFDSNSKER